MEGGGTKMVRFYQWASDGATFFFTGKHHTCTCCISISPSWAHPLLPQFPAILGASKPLAHARLTARLPGPCIVSPDSVRVSRYLPSFAQIPFAFTPNQVGVKQGGLRNGELLITIRSNPNGRLATRSVRQHQYRTVILNARCFASSPGKLASPLRLAELALRHSVGLPKVGLLFCASRVRLRGSWPPLVLPKSIL